MLFPSISPNNTEAPSPMNTLLHVWNDDYGQDVAEYAVMLAVILIIVIGTLKLIGGKSNNVFSEVASSLPG
jgi:Flp pilus assembly pilin Flp